MKERWFVKDKAKIYIVKDQKGKRDAVFTCWYGHLTTLGACYGICRYNGRCAAAWAAFRAKKEHENVAKAQE